MRSFSVVMIAFLSASLVIAQEPAPLTKGTFVLRGLHCQPCTATVAASLKKVPGVQSVKVDWTTKNAWIDFDERQVSAQGLAQRIAATPHMMGRNMHYSGALALKVPDLTDDAAAKAIESLKGVPGVVKVTPFVKQHSVTVEFDGKGDLRSEQLIEALANAGFKAENHR